MSELSLGWLELKSIAQWVIKGPRSIVSQSEPSGGASGWVDRMMHWQRYAPADGLAESRSIFQRPGYEEMSVSPFVIRAATWDKRRDRVASREQEVGTISLKVEHFETNKSTVARITAIEEALQKSLATIAANDSAISEGSHAVYRWSFAGKSVIQELFWVSATNSRDLEDLWNETLPKTSGLKRLDGLIERFDIDPFGTYIDAAVEQIPTIHQLM